MKILSLLMASVLSMGLPALAFPADVTTSLSDQKTTEPAVVSAVKQANKSVYVAIYSLTDQNIVDALIYAKQHGARVEVKYDSVQSSQKNMAANLVRLSQADIPADKIVVRNRGVMHHKFAVVDERMVVTGSYNWTANATQNNWENLVVIVSNDVARIYKAEWDRIKTK